jgi:hypothetical protein
MLARLTLTMGPRTVIALLGEDLKWRSEDLLTQSYLNSCYGPPEEGTLSMGPTGYQQATRAAQAVQAAGWEVNMYMPELNQSAA